MARKSCNVVRHPVVSKLSRLKSVRFSVLGVGIYFINVFSAQNLVLQGHGLFHSVTDSFNTACTYISK